MIWIDYFIVAALSGLAAYVSWRMLAVLIRDDGLGVDDEPEQDPMWRHL